MVLISLEYRRERSDMLQTLRIVKYKIDKTKQDILHKREGSTTRGHSTKLYKKRVKNNCYKNFFSNRIINDWNSLSSEIAEAQTLNSFKNRLNKMWRKDNKFNPTCYDIQLIQSIRNLIQVFSCIY